MRLVDADWISYRTYVDNDPTTNSLFVTKAEIDRMPTVEAIPVEWIEHYCIEHMTMINRRRNKGNGWAFKFSAHRQVKEMIKEWRKENENY